MMRLATGLVMLTIVLGALAAPEEARAAGCEVLTAPAERAECVARAQAREAARAEVARKVEDRPATNGTARSKEWQRAIEESKGLDAAALLDARLVAAVGGLAWFVLAVRARRRARRRASAG